MEALKLVKNLLTEHKIQTVYHAAAYKHVPLIEENPFEGLKNNILATEILLKEKRSIDVVLNGSSLVKYSFF